jgi:hypothetical protein
MTTRPLVLFFTVVAATAHAQSIQMRTDDKLIDVGTGGIVVTEEGPTRKFDGLGGKQTFACARGQAIEVNGMGQQVTLTGECGKVTVAGTDNEVQLEAASAISVSGVNNQVTWRRGVSGKAPSIARSGLRNKVAKRD